MQKSIKYDLSNPAIQRLEEIMRNLAVLHEIPEDTVHLSKTFVHPEGFYQSYEQLPASYTFRSKKTLIVVDHTGIEFSTILYPWEQIVFTGFIWCSIFKNDDSESSEPYFQPIFVMVTSENELMIAENIKGEEYGSIVQIYRRRWQHLKDHPLAEPKPFHYSIRTAKHTDLDILLKMLKETIFSVNARDYSPNQIAVWIASAENRELWTKRLNEQYFLVAENAEEITGFASIDPRGCIDLLYVYKDHQRKGIAEKLLEDLEKHASENKLAEVWADVSLTARSFFASKGFTIKRDYFKFVQGIEFNNAIMVKSLKEKK